MEDRIQQLLTKLEQEVSEKQELIKDIRGSNKSTKLFAPKFLKEIKGLDLEVIGLNYIPLIKGAYNILTGRGGSGKSAVALKSMVMYLAANKEKTGLAFFTEDGKEDILTRLNIICKGENLNTEDMLNRIHFITVENDDRIKWAKSSRDGYVVERNYIDEVIEFCKASNVGYIIIDPLKRFHSLSENSNDDMDILVRDVFVDMAVKTEAVLLVLHHSAKSGDTGAARGAGTITDSARLGWQIGRYYIKNEKTGEIVVDESKKNKIKLSIIKDNQGLESRCNIRDENDNSIANPLSSAGFGYGNPQPKESVPYEMSEDLGFDAAEIPDMNW